MNAPSDQRQSPSAILAQGAAINRRKVYSADGVAGLARQLRAEGKRVVHCHGVFDLLHIGHIRHLEDARRLGDILIVTIVGDDQIKGSMGPTFSDELRLEALSALECVDYVALASTASGADVIRALRPNFYVQGADYLQVGADGADTIEHEEANAAIRQVGGELVVTDDIVFSSSALVHGRMSFPESTRHWIREFAERFSSEQLIFALENLKSARVLVVGEAIIDDYCYVQALGKSAKDPVLAARHASSKTFAGGTLAIANHIAALSEQVSLVTFVGQDSDSRRFVDNHLNPTINARLMIWDSAPTIVKRRYIDEYSATKLFEVYEMAPDPPIDDDKLCTELSEELARHDVVIVADYGHGMLTPLSVELLCAESKFLALNVQSNAGNHGFHTLGTYPRADYICSSETEFRLEVRSRHPGCAQVVANVSRRLDCPQTVMTRGKYGCIVYSDCAGTVEVPAVAPQVVDRVGAGDAFLAISSPLVANGMPLEAAAFVGSLASAHAVATVGHDESIERYALYKRLRSLLAGASDGTAIASSKHLR